MFCAGSSMGIREEMPREDARHLWKPGASTAERRKSTAITHGGDLLAQPSWLPKDCTVRRSCRRRSEQPAARASYDSEQMRFQLIRLPREEKSLCIGAQVYHIDRRLQRISYALAMVIRPAPHHERFASRIPDTNNIRTQTMIYDQSIFTVFCSFV